MEFMGYDYIHAGQQDRPRVSWVVQGPTRRRRPRTVLEAKRGAERSAMDIPMYVM